jgi:hypothetical protein
MRIVINGLFVVPNQVGGSETYLRGLIAGLAQVDTQNQYTLCLGPEAARTFRAPNERWRILASPAPSALRPVRLTLEQLWLPRIAAKLGADLIHSAGYTGPLVSQARRVTSILDMNAASMPRSSLLSPGGRTACSRCPKRRVPTLSTGPAYRARRCPQFPWHPESVGLVTRPMTRRD